MDQTLFAVLTSEKSKFDVSFDSRQHNAIQSAMQIYAMRVLAEYREAENKSVNLEAIKLFPALYKGQFKLWLRKRSFLKAKKAAQIQADIENRPFYVIRSTQIAYVVQSTEVARNLTRRRIYRKGTNAIKMNNTADFTAYPIAETNFNKVIQDWKNVDRSKLKEDKQVIYDKFKPVINSLLKSEFGIKE